TGAPVIDHVNSRVVIVVVQHFDEHAVRILAGRFRSIQPRCRAGPCAGHHQQEKSARAPNHGAGASRTKVWLAVVLRPSSRRTTTAPSCVPSPYVAIRSPASPAEIANGASMASKRLMRACSVPSMSRMRAYPCSGCTVSLNEKTIESPACAGLGAISRLVMLSAKSSLQPSAAKRTNRHARRALVMPPPRQYLRRSERVRNIARLAAYRPLSYDAPPSER